MRTVLAIHKIFLSQRPLSVHTAQSREVLRVFAEFFIGQWLQCLETCFSSMLAYKWFPLALTALSFIQKKIFVETQLPNRLQCLFLYNDTV